MLPNKHNFISANEEPRGTGEEREGEGEQISKTAASAPNDPLPLWKTAYHGIPGERRETQLQEDLQPPAKT